MTKAWNAVTLSEAKGLAEPFFSALDRGKREVNRHALSTL
jgi:hypothetical protein